MSCSRRPQRVVNMQPRVHPFFLSSLFIFEGPGPEAAVHHERPWRGGRGRGRGRDIFTLLLQCCGRYDLPKFLLPLVPLVAAVQHTLARLLVDHLQRPLLRGVQCGHAAAPTPVATFMM